MLHDLRRPRQTLIDTPTRTGAIADASLFEKVARLQGYERITASQLEDTGKILGACELVAKQPVAHSPQLKTVEIADELMNDIRRRMNAGLDAVRRQLREHIGSIAEHGLRRVAHASTRSGAPPCIRRR